MKELIGFFAMATVWGGSIAAWITAIVHCISEEMYVMLFIDGFIAPIGIIHGLMIWIS